MRTAESGASIGGEGLDARRLRRRELITFRERAQPDLANAEATSAIAAGTVPSRRQSVK